MKKENKSEQRESPRGRSMLSLYRDCPRKWAFKYLKGFLPKGRSNALVLGSLIHDTQALFYSGMTFQESLKELELLAPEDLKLKASEMYKEWFRVIGEKDLKNSIVLSIEEENFLTLPNGFKMTVRYDRILQDKESKEIFISDTKTTGGNALKTLLQYNYSDQPKLYIAAFRENKKLWLKNFSGWRTDVIYGRELRSGKVSTEAIRDEVISFPDDEIEDALISYAILTDEIRYHLEEVLEGKSIKKNFYSNSDFCFSYGNLCPYKEICSKIDDINFIPKNFDLDPWLKEKKVLESFNY